MTQIAEKFSKHKIRPKGHQKGYQNETKEGPN